MTTNLQKYVGQQAEPVRVSRLPVSEAMIRNWVEALEDTNPVYVDADAARAQGLPGVTCPPAMISTWVMAGYRRYRQTQRLRAQGMSEDFAYARLMRELDEAGFTSVVATDVEQTYLASVHPGQRVSCHYVIETVSEQKSTALGDGHFVTLHKTYVDQDEVVLVEERFRLLRFKPRETK